jgi:hypothetical protein
LGCCPPVRNTASNDVFTCGLVRLAAGGSSTIEWDEATVSTANDAAETTELTILTPVDNTGARSAGEFFVNCRAEAGTGTIENIHFTAIKVEQAHYLTGY